MIKLFKYFLFAQRMGNLDVAIKTMIDQYENYKCKLMKLYLCKGMHHHFWLVLYFAWSDLSVVFFGDFVSSFVLTLCMTVYISLLQEQNIFFANQYALEQIFFEVHCN